ncbi:MAG: hypothetical protein ACRD2W_24590 [Acidimicrobiales bacterium]
MIVTTPTNGERVGLASVPAQVPGEWAAVDQLRFARPGCSDDDDLGPRIGGVAPPFPWTYPYQEDGTRFEAIVLRPLVPVTLVGAEASLVGFALIDSGSEHILVSPFLAASARVDAEAGHRSLELGIGGDAVAVRFVDLTLRLHAPGDDQDDYVEWNAEVGVVSQWSRAGR